MANKKPEAEAEAAIPVMALPEGFEVVTPVDSGNRCWLEKAPGVTVIGQLLGRFERKGTDKDKTSFYYQVKITGFAKDKDGSVIPIKAVKGNGKDKETIVLIVGDVVNIDEISAISDLQKYADSDGVYSVFLQFIDKVGIQGGRSFWRVNVGAKTLKTPSMPLSKFVDGSGTQTDDMGASY